MSVLNVERATLHAVQNECATKLPTSIQDKLSVVDHQNRRADVVHFVAVASALGLSLLLAFVILDVFVTLRWTPIRWTIWVVSVGAVVSTIWLFLVRMRRRETHFLDTAWRIEARHPSMEERLTSTVQFLGEGSNEHVSPKLISALVTETTESLESVNAGSIPTRSTRIPVAIVTLLATGCVVASVFWPQPILTSLDNLATPWSAYLVPTLSAQITPGDVTIVQGESLNIRAESDALGPATLEITRGDVVETLGMTERSADVAMFTLPDIQEHATYRVHAGGLSSVPFTITVLPRPQLKAITGHLTFPLYVDLEPQTIESMDGPIEMPAGGEVTLVAEADSAAVEGIIRWESGADAVPQKAIRTGSADTVGFEWTFRVEPKMNLSGTLSVRSQHGVESESHPIEIRAVDDRAPRIEITSPRLKELTIPRDGELPVRYRVYDDFGVSKTEWMVRFDKEEPITMPCPALEYQSGDQPVWTGETSLELSQVPDGCSDVWFWLRVADNRPEAFGGVQVVESDPIHVTLDDAADSLGQQQILADRQTIEPSIDRAIQQVQAAREAAQALHEATDDRQHSAETDPATNDDSNDADHQNAEGVSDLRDGQHESRADHVDRLREQTLQAKQTLDQLAERLRDEPNSFQPNAAKIQQLADQEVTEALERANQIPLADDRSEQDQLAREAQHQLNLARNQLEQLKSNIDQQAERMEQAVALDELARKQEQLARQVKEGDQEVPEEPWRDQQQKIADDLQELAEENKESRRQRLQQKADEAEQLAKQAHELAKQQRQLQEFRQDDPPTEAAKQSGKDSIKAQNDDGEPKEEKADQQNGRQANNADMEGGEKQNQSLDPVADEEQKRRRDQAAARIQEQIADEIEQIQQQAKQLANDDSEPQANERAKQAVEQLQQATRKAKDAKQSLCEKCQGGGSNKQSSPSEAKGQASNQQPGDSPDSNKANSNKANSNKANSNKANSNKANSNKANSNKPAFNKPSPGKRESEKSGRESETKQPSASPREDAQLRRDQQDAAQALEQAARSLEQMCKSCRECADGKPQESAGKSKSGQTKRGGSQGKDAPAGEQRLANASEQASQAAKSSSKEEAAQNAQSASEQLNQLAEEAAQRSGIPRRDQKGLPGGQGERGGQGKRDGVVETADRAQGDKSEQASREPGGVGGVAGETQVTDQALRAASTSNWTRSRRKLGGGVLDDREGSVPEQYQDVVERYFEELSRQQTGQED